MLVYDKMIYGGTKGTTAMRRICGITVVLILQLKLDVLDGVGSTKI